MKLLCTGDWHIRENNPEYRTDDFKQALKDKLNFIKQVAREEQVEYILQPGDFFDNASKVSYAALLEWTEFFRGFPPICTVLGQHDLKNHSLENKNIPAYILQQIGTIELPHDYGLFFDGFHFGQEIKELNDIMLIHTMVIKDKPLWEGQEEYTKANTLLKKTKYKLIVSGDNHQCFVHRYKDRILVNAGSLMRTAKNQNHHTPMIFIYNTDDCSLKQILIPVRSFHAVFDTERMSDEKQKAEELNELVNTMREGFTSSLNFMQNLAKLKQKADTATLKILDEIYEEV